MAKRPQTYQNASLTVTFDPRVCEHSGTCLLALPAVFDIRHRRWVRLEGAPAEDIAAAVARCPSGALQAVLKEGTAPPPAEATDDVPTVEVRPNGSLRFTGKVRITLETGEVVEREGRFSLCRCGHSQNKPFCDASHKRVGWRSDVTETPA